MALTLELIYPIRSILFNRAYLLLLLNILFLYLQRSSWEMVGNERETQRANRNTHSAGNLFTVYGEAKLTYSWNIKITY